MEEKEAILKIISNETKKSIGDLSVVTPSVYASIFSKFALTHNTDLHESEKIGNLFIDEKISYLTDLQNQTSNNASKLNEQAIEAITAIKEKDDLLLNKVLQETQELRQEIEKLKESLYKDALTNTYTRKWLCETLLNTQTQKFKNSGTLAIIDLNYFKIINDTYGHVIGDKVLIFIAHQLKKIKGDVVRYGGDEFIIHFPKNTPKKSALMQLDNLREAVLHKNLKVKEAEFKISFSFGVQTYLPNHELSDVIDAADKEMYQDKLQIKERIQGVNPHL